MYSISFGHALLLLLSLLLPAQQHAAMPVSLSMVPEMSSARLTAKLSTQASMNRLHDWVMLLCSAYIACS
jgi:hypothetical protein